MVVNLDEIAKEAFNILRSFDYTVMMYDDDGTQIYEPENARRMFAKPENLLVSIVDDNDNTRINLYLSGDTDAESVLGLITSLRTLATKYNINFHNQKWDRDLTVKDFATKNSVRETVTPMMMDLTEGMYGTSRSSYLKLENARMIVRHSAKIDETIAGARSRRVESIFVENSQGERFLFPTKQLAPARAMTQHLNHGGGFADEVGQQINQMAQDYAALGQASSFIGMNQPVLGEGAMDLREKCRTTRKGLRKCFERLYRESSYAGQADTLREAAANPVLVEDAAIARLREMLTVDGKELSEEVISTIARCVEAAQPVLDEAVNEDCSMPTEEAEKILRDEFISLEAVRSASVAEVKPWTDGGYVLLLDDAEEAEFNSKEVADKVAAAVDCVREHGSELRETPAVAGEAPAETKPAPVSRARGPVVKVLGREVDEDAWEAFKQGKLELRASPESIEGPGPSFTSKQAEVAHHLRAMGPLCMNDSMSNLLSWAAEELPMATDKLLRQLMTLGTHACQTAQVTVTEGLGFRGSAVIREFEEWFDSMGSDRVLAPGDEMSAMEDDMVPMAADMADIGAELTPEAPYAGPTEEVDDETMAADIANGYTEGSNWRLVFNEKEQAFEMIGEKTALIQISNAVLGGSRNGSVHSAPEDGARQSFEWSIEDTIAVTDVPASVPAPVMTPPAEMADIAFDPMMGESELTREDILLPKDDAEADLKQEVGHDVESKDDFVRGEDDLTMERLRKLSGIKIAD